MKAIISNKTISALTLVALTALATSSRAEEAHTTPLLTALSATTVSGYVEAAVIRHSKATVVTTVVAADKTAPIVNVTAPANKLIVNSSPVTVTGTASDAGGVSSVTVLFQSQTNIADGTTAWSTSLNLTPGTNNYYVWATDNSGNHSKPVMRSVFFATPTTLTVATNGNGKVTGVVNQSTVLIGRGYRAIAAPSAGWLFADWTDGNGTLLGTNKVLDFVMQDSETITARFVTNLFIKMAGTYRGLYGAINPQQQPPTEGGNQDQAAVTTVAPGKSGLVTFTTTKTGSFSGKFYWKASTFPFSGSFYDNQDGTATSDVEILHGTNPPFELHLSIDTNPKTGLLTGLVATEDWESDLSGQMDKYVANHPKPGRFNFGIGSTRYDGSGPAGYGYGSIIVSKIGAVTMSVTLADSTTAVAFASAVNGSSTFPFYIPRNSGNGLIIGWMAFDSTTLTDVRGTNVTWIRPTSTGAFFPSGFNLSDVPVFGAMYPAVGTKSQLGWTTGYIYYRGDSIGGEYLNHLSYDLKKNTIGVSDSNANLLKMSFNKSTGAISGSFLSPVTNKRQNFQGLLIPKSDYAPLPFGVGFFLTPSESGEIIIGPY